MYNFGLPNCLILLSILCITVMQARSRKLLIRIRHILKSSDFVTTTAAVTGVNKCTMEVDEALGKLGVIGRWQILHYTLICITCSFSPCFHSLAIIYIGQLKVPAP